MSTSGFRNADFKAVILGDDRMEEISQFINNHFTPRETLISKCKFSVEDIGECLTKLVEECLAFGASSAVIHIPTQEIAGVCLTKILTKEAKSGFENTQTVNDKEKYFMNVISQVEKYYDVFKDPKVNNVMEFVMLSANAKFSRKGISYMTIGKCEEYAKKIGCQLGYSQSTGPVSQHIRGKCGYDCVGKVFYNSLIMEGEPLDKSEGESGPFIGLYLKDFNKN